MALSTIIRRSASSVTPLAARLLAGQRNFHHHCRGALHFAINSTRNIISDNPFLVRSVSSYSYSASPALQLPSSDESLLRVIESEINCCEESFEESEGVPEGFSFQLNDNLGQQTISLTREYQGETIHVEVEPSDLDTGEDDSDPNSDSDDNNNNTQSDIQSSLPMVVKISKPGAPGLEFGITAYSDEIVIESLSVKDPDLSEDQLPYGPRFDELDENMQKAFHKYLETRGIKASATKFLHEYMVNKDHKEYTNWLKNLKKFLDA